MRNSVMPTLIATLAALGLLLSGLSAGAQTESAGPESADDDLEEAVRQSELGRLYYDGDEFERAAAAFSRAFELQPDPVLGYNAARSYENSGEYEAALEYYRRTLALDIADEQLRQRCEDGTTRIENVLANIAAERQREPAQLSVHSDPPGASVLVDGVHYAHTPADFPLPAGTYTLEIALAGHEPYAETTTLAPGQAVALRVTLEERPPPPAPEPPQEGGPDWLSVGITGGIGVALVGLGAVAALGAQERYDDAQTPEVLRDDERYRQVVDEGRDLQTTSAVFYGLGIAAIATAVVLYFVTDDSPDDDAGIEVDVTLGPERVGAGLGWTF